MLFMSQNLVGLIGKVGNPSKIERKGSRKPRSEDVRVWRRRWYSIILNVAGHFEILFSIVVMRKEVRVWRRGR